MECTRYALRRRGVVDLRFPRSLGEQAGHGTIPADSVRTLRREVGTLFPPLKIVSISRANRRFSTEYIPPRAPSKPQFQAAKACPYRKAALTSASVKLRKLLRPPAPRIEINPAVHQSPAPQVSARTGAATLGRWFHALELPRGNQLLNRRPLWPNVQISRRTEFEGRREDGSLPRLCAYFRTCAIAKALRSSRGSDRVEGSKTMTAPRSDAAVARSIAPGESRSTKNT
jgi:hypothetical protein